MKIAMHQLKAGLSRYVALARAGEVVEIASHGKLVARLIGMPMKTQTGLAGLLASGAASWSGGKPALRPPVTLAPHPRSLSETVVEDRG
jgi:prevent-host-death family protein